MMVHARHAPIIHYDLSGFSRYNLAEKREILTRLGRILVGAFKPHIGRSDPKNLFDWHGSGDGHFITLTTEYPTPVAMRFVWDLEQALMQENEHNPDYPLLLRVSLALGDLEMVGDQRLSDAYIEDARLIDHELIRKWRDSDAKSPVVVAATALFMGNWNNHPEKDEDSLAVPGKDRWPWTPHAFPIKHDQTLRAYLRLAKEQVQLLIGTEGRNKSSGGNGSTQRAPSNGGDREPVQGNVSGHSEASNPVRVPSRENGDPIHVGIITMKPEELEVAPKESNSRESPSIAHIVTHIF